MFFKRNLSTFAFISLLFLAVFALSGCGSPKSSPETPDNGVHPSGETELTGSITVVGSTSVQPVSDLLAEAFMDEHPGTNIYVQGGGSSAGIRAADDGAAEIGASSRDLKDDEKHLKQYIIAKDGIAVVVHPSSNVSDLTIEQIRDIYAGNITNWSEAGGSNELIIVVTREEGSGTRSAFEEIVMGKDAITGKAIVQNSTGAVVTTVAGDKNAIGYISLASLKENVKALKVEGVEVTRDNIAAGSYKVARPFIYVTKGEPAGLAKSFLDFVLSPDAQGIIEQAGLVSVN
ncbi:MAG: phosphate-binding protein [Firmicutes bacterium HGW-Firmicutes-13]|nr:MAG: phosphate-binding protein [Firmicutes bacterium HGW-Firmicutes-13]